MNEQLRQFERESGLEIFGLGAKRVKWEAAMEKFAELIVNECNEINKQELAFNAFERLMNRYQEHFTVEEPKGWICPKCNADRTKIACPLGFGATVDGRCPMVVTAQGVEE
jgi:hypothetical protein